MRIGALEPGPENAITDVPACASAMSPSGATSPTAAAARAPASRRSCPGAAETLFAKPVPAGAAVLNGAGEMTGFLAISEWGIVETPVYLTSTMAVGRIFDGAIAEAVASDPAVGRDNVVIPVVAECDDSWLNDAGPVQVEAADAGRALAAAAGGPVAEGAVGAGDRDDLLRLEGRHRHREPGRAGAGATVGVLVLANFGAATELRVDGVPVGRVLPDPETWREPAGSCIAVVATDAPLAPAQLQRIARRAGLGLARTGSVAHHGSGEIFLAFSTSGRRPRAEVGRRARPDSLADAELDPLFAATVEATEEAVLNALWAAPDVTGRAGRAVRGLPHDAVLDLLRAHGRTAA